MTWEAWRWRSGFERILLLLFVLFAAGLRSMGHAASKEGIRGMGMAWGHGPRSRYPRIRKMVLWTIHF